MKYFVSADIHGFFDEWMSALKKNDFDIDNQQHKIVVCGDLFDRGRQPKQIIDFVLAHKNKIILIKGNHEYLIEEMIERNKNRSFPGEPSVRKERYGQAGDGSKAGKRDGINESRK